MPTILIVWELGGGLGHLVQLMPLAAALVKRGYRVHVALRHLSMPAAEVFGRAGVSFRQAPFKSTGTRPFARTTGFAHVLANTGWGAAGELALLAYAWRNLIQDVRPDLIIFDHAPLALLGSRGLPRAVRRVLIGSGFCCPPDTFPLPSLVDGADAATLARDEAAILARTNHVLGKWGKPPLERLGQLYSEVDETFLTAFAELEQFPSRVWATYWGPVIGGAAGQAPRWPEAGGKRVLAYLKRCPALPGVLSVLNQRQLPTVAYVDGLGEAGYRKLESPTLRFSRHPLDLRRAAAECDLAVLHAGQGATAAVLLAGKPILQLPLVLEQRLTADATVRLGAGERASASDPAAVRQKLDAMLATDRYADAAERFAAKYAGFAPAAQVERMAGRMEELLGGERRPRARQRGAESSGAAVWSKTPVEPAALPA